MNTLHTQDEAKSGIQATLDCTKPQTSEITMKTADEISGWIFTLHGIGINDYTKAKMYRIIQSAIDEAATCQWIKTADRPPTKEDGNEKGRVLWGEVAIVGIVSQKIGYWDTARPYYFWMPIPPVPKDQQTPVEPSRKQEPSADAATRVEPTDKE